MAECAIRQLFKKMTLIVSLKTPLFNHLHQAAQTQASGDTAQKTLAEKQNNVLGDKSLSKTSLSRTPKRQKLGREKCEKQA